MSFSSTPQQRLLFEKMRHTQARQEVAGKNLANVGVAGAQAEALGDFKAKVSRGHNPAAVATTSAGHLSGVKSSQGFRVTGSKNQGEPTLTGNSINADEELAKLNESATDFYRLTQIVSNEKARSRLIAKFGTGK